MKYAHFRSHEGCCEGISQLLWKRTIAAEFVTKYVTAVCSCSQKDTHKHKNVVTVIRCHHNESIHD